MGIAAVLGTLISALFGEQKTSIPNPANATSQQILSPLLASRRRLAKAGGRKSTLLTGGLIGTPSLLKQGLTV